MSTRTHSRQPVHIIHPTPVRDPKPADTPPPAYQQWCASLPITAEGTAQEMRGLAHLMIAWSNQVDDPGQEAREQVAQVVASTLDRLASDLKPSTARPR